MSRRCRYPACPHPHQDSGSAGIHLAGQLVRQVLTGGLPDGGFTRYGGLRPFRPTSMRMSWPKASLCRPPACPKIGCPPVRNMCLLLTLNQVGLHIQDSFNKYTSYTIQVQYSSMFLILELSLFVGQFPSCSSIVLYHSFIPWHQPMWIV